ERRTDDAERLARAALVAAEGGGENDVACEALIVIGRLARAADLDRAEAAFVRAHELAEAHQLTVWRSRALHELAPSTCFGMLPLSDCWRHARWRSSRGLSRPWHGSMASCRLCTTR